MSQNTFTWLISSHTIHYVVYSNSRSLPWGQQNLGNPEGQLCKPCKVCNTQWEDGSHACLQQPLDSDTMKSATSVLATNYQTDNLQPASCQFLVRHALKHWRWRQQVCVKHLQTFSTPRTLTFKNILFLCCKNLISSTIRGICWHISSCSYNKYKSRILSFYENMETC